MGRGGQTAPRPPGIRRTVAGSCAGREGRSCASCSLSTTAVPILPSSICAPRRDPWCARARRGASSPPTRTAWCTSRSSSRASRSRQPLRTTNDGARLRASERRRPSPSRRIPARKGRWHSTHTTAAASERRIRRGRSRWHSTARGGRWHSAQTSAFLQLHSPSTQVGARLRIGNKHIHRVHLPKIGGLRTKPALREVACNCL